MFIQYCTVFLAGFISVVIFIAILKKMAVRVRFPSFGKIPLIGGLGMGAAFFLACFYGAHILKAWTVSLIALLAASALMLLFGLLDDIRELSVLTKFIVQIAVVSVLIFFGVQTHIIYIGNMLNIVITVIWFVGITNAFNLLDIGDGLAGGISLISSVSFAVIAYMHGDTGMLVISLALAGAVLGFLIYNFPPAKVYMGNSGSHFLGLVLASTALGIHYATMERKIALASPLLILGLPIVDTAFLTIVRMRKKKIPFYKSGDHIYLRLLRLGYSKRSSLFVLLGMGGIFSLSGILLTRVSLVTAVVILLFVSFLNLVVVRNVLRRAGDE